MRLYLINPANPLVPLTQLRRNRWNRYRVWKPLGLLTVAGLTPTEWDIEIIDEHLGVPDYESMPRPDLVGITAFTSQATHAYLLADRFRRRGIPVIMGGVHATMRQEEALEHVDAIVTGEAENIWTQVLKDAVQGDLKRVYTGTYADMHKIPPARHDLSPAGYRLGSIQTTRGCPLNCSFCSVSVFNGSRYRFRPIEDVIHEFGLIKEKLVLIVDDNLIGTRRNHVARAKELFRAMIDAGIQKKWIAQVTVNLADDEELLELAASAGCVGVFVGFESSSSEGLLELRKRFNLRNNRDFRESVKRIQARGIAVAGSFIIGLDVDTKGIGRRLADTADDYGLDALNVLFLTPLPGTSLWDKMQVEDRIWVNRFPEDWKYYTLSFPVAVYRQFSCEAILREMESCHRTFYALPKVARRTFANFWRRRQPIATLVSNLSMRGNARNFDRTAFLQLCRLRGQARAERPIPSRVVPSRRAFRAASTSPETAPST
jgi:radical SAM superfamily enzyme YgiQ (UPF0313 family)